MKYFDKVDEHEWCFVEPKCVDKHMDNFHSALDMLDHGDLDSARKMLISILEKCPEHIDAIHHLAQIAYYDGRLDIFQKLEELAVSIVLNNLPKKFQMGVDKLEWGWLENRPFLRAYEGLAEALMVSDDIEGALKIYHNILALNPNDNQGVRAFVVECYFRLNRSEGIVSICEKFPEDMMSEITFSHPLALFQLDRLDDAKEQLKIALKWFPLVAEELLKKRHTRPKSKIAGYISFGGADQAYAYWETFGIYWRNTLGALKFLRENK